jgi:hypothetical protein
MEQQTGGGALIVDIHELGGVALVRWGRNLNIWSVMQRTERL